MAEKWTESQLRAITSEGEVLVSASAGSGKTSVMTERILQKLLAGAAHVEEILALTFSRASAEDMRQKLEKKLISAYKAAEGDVKKRLIRELDYLPLAGIGTIDSFCQSVIKKYFDKIGIDPGFGVITENEERDYKSRAMERTLTGYAEAEAGYAELLDMLGKKRSEKPVEEIILTCYGFTRVLPDGNWLERVKNGTDLSDAEKWLNAYAARVIGSLIDEGERLIVSAGRDLPVVTERLDRLKLARRGGESLVCALGDKPYSLTLANGFPRTSKNASDYEAALMARVKAETAEWRDRVNDVEKELRKVCLAPKPSRSREVSLIIGLTELFSLNYAELKAKDNKLDFADMEHYCLQALSVEEVRREISDKYRYVFVDEYQDTNRLQEAILCSVTRDNCFMVGDIKQSIYGFRNTDPELFLEKYGSSLCTSIDLSENFRTDKAILEFVNTVFGSLMSKETGDIAYSDNPMIAGLGYEKVSDIPPVTVTAFIKSRETGKLAEGVYSVREASAVRKGISSEAADICERIVGMVMKENIYDPKTGEVRKIRHGDIAILTRSNVGVSELSDALKNYGIPYRAEKRGELPPSVLPLIDFVRVLENSRQDIPLCSVLLNVFGFTEEEAADIATCEGGYFYEKVKNAAEGGVSAPLREKLSGALNALEKYRRKAGYLSVYELLCDVTDETDYVHKVSKRGLSYDGVDSFLAGIGNTSFSGNIYDFVRFISDYVPEKSTVSDSGEAVTVMTVHKSKGLEFPVVFVADAGRTYTDGFKGSEMTYDKDLGMAIMEYDPATRLKRDNYLTSLIRLKAKDEGRREEMRLLYVALTRAKNHLFVSGTLQGEKYSRFASNSLSRIMALKDSFGEGVSVSERDDGEAGVLSPGKKILAFREPDAEYLRQIRQIINYEYPYSEMTKSGLKYAVTAIAEGTEIYPDEDRTGTGKARAELGTAYHKVLQNIDFSVSGSEIGRELESMVQAGILTPEERERIDVNIIERVLHTPLFDSARAGRAEREKPFVYKMSARRAGVNSDEEIMVQGVIDLIVFGKENIIADYKLSGADDETLRRRYGEQLNVYREAAEAILDTKIDKCYIVSLGRGAVIEVLRKKA